MPITSIDTDVEALTMTVVADFTVPARRLWEAYSDPRQLEKFWGPPAWPATFSRHDMAPGGQSRYYMSGPDGERMDGLWEIVRVEAPHTLEVRDRFVGDDGRADEDMPTMRVVFDFEDTDAGSRLVVTTWFNSVPDLEQMLEMGMDEGLSTAMGQIDQVVADLTSFAAGAGTTLQVLDKTHVRVSRIIRGPVEKVWDAHHDPDLMKRWMLGPDGWTMPVCEVATAVGDSYRNEWVDGDGENGFGFTGELLESAHPYRAVTTERMIGTDGPTNVNEMTLTRTDDGTLLSMLITYQDLQTRDMILATGMTEGMESSYARMESELMGVA
ncbi:MAG: SRPBCC family protein [Arachnia sp.]